MHTDTRTHTLTHHAHTHTLYTHKHPHIPLSANIQKYIMTYQAMPRNKTTTPNKEVSHVQRYTLIQAQCDIIPAPTDCLMPVHFRGDKLMI